MGRVTDPGGHVASFGVPGASPKRLGPGNPAPSGRGMVTIPQWSPIKNGDLGPIIGFTL